YGALINGGTICLYDGAPDYPTPDRMWEFCAKHKVEFLGISPTLVRALAAHEETETADASVTDASVAGAGLAASGHEDKRVLAPFQRRGWSRHGKLPHFDGEVTQFVTFRLADSLPHGVLERLKLQVQQDKLDDNSEEFRQRVEEQLDQGAGECLLKRKDVAE